MPLNRRFIIGIAFFSLLVFAVLLGTGVIPGFKKRTAKTELVVWGIDKSSSWEPIAAAYHEKNPAITVIYRELPAATYETDLVNGLATGNGPDIFMIGNAWLPKHGNKLFPAPQDIMPTARMDELFPAATLQDFTANGAVYALPLYMDTLALIYNKDIFDAKGIATPPKNWLDFQELVRKLGKNSAAIGGSGRTIESASDVVALLMMQSGAPMQDNDGAPSFKGGDDALAFYTKFGNPKSAYYAWDNKEPSAATRFAQGTLPMMFGYHSLTNALRAGFPALRIGVSPMPQSGTAQAVNHPSYAGLAVWSQSRNPVLAWQFIADVAASPEDSFAYLNLSNRPPALRALLSTFSEDPNRAVFAGQALTARSWPRRDEARASATISRMVESVIRDGQTPSTAIRNADDDLRN